METNSLNVANIIKDQLGHKCLFLIGAQNFVGGSNFLQFKIRGSHVANWIKITLDPSDTYTMLFFKIRKGEIKIVKEINGVYFDQLHEMIESVTGLITRL